MVNPQINFRLQQHQIARGIQHLLLQKPHQEPLSASLLIKTIYLDTIAKAVAKNHTGISPAILEVADALTQQTKVPLQERDRLWEIAVNQNIAEWQQIDHPKQHQDDPTQRIANLELVIVELTNRLNGLEDSSLHASTNLTELTKLVCEPKKSQAEQTVQMGYQLG